MTATRTRMPRTQRRAQLIELGKEAVAATSFDEVSVEQVADAAGISRGLLFHYFPTRRDFLQAVAAAAAAELVAATEPPPDADPVTQLRTSLRAYVDYIVEHDRAYLSLVRGAAGGEAGMLEVLDGTRALLADRVLTGVGMDPAQTAPVVRLGLRGWIGFVEEATVAWLADRTQLDRDDLVGLCERTLVAVFADTTGLDLAAVQGR